jgi:hypothetical protein
MDSRIKKLIATPEFTECLGVTEEDFLNLYESVVTHGVSEPAEYREMVMAKVVMKFVKIESELKLLTKQKDMLRDSILSLAGNKPYEHVFDVNRVLITESSKNKKVFDEESFKSDHMIAYKVWKKLEEKKDKYVKTEPNGTYLSLKVNSVKL